MRKEKQNLKVLPKCNLSSLKGGRKNKSLKMKTNLTAALASGATYCPPPEPSDNI